MVATGLRTLRSFDQTVATDLDPRRAADLADVVVDDARAVAARCDIVILATWSRVPLLHAEDIATVTHLTTLGADEPGKIELAADVLRRSRVVVDDVELVGSALLASARGTGYRRIAAALGRPLSTVRRWIRAVRDAEHVEWLRAQAVEWLARVDRDVLGGLQPEATRLGEALTALAAAAVTLRARVARACRSGR